MKLEEVKALYIKARDAYYNTGKPILTDAQYDKMEDWLRKKVPDWPELNKTGILPKSVGKKTEVKLPFYMPSLAKFYPEEVDRLWSKLSSVDSEFIYMAKLDGCSVLLEYSDGKPKKLTTRGNGAIGKDISFLIPYTRLGPIEDKGYHAFRCEAIIKKSIFASKWKDQFDNARNMVSGILNRTDAHPALKDISFVVLGEYDKPIKRGLMDAKYKYSLEIVSFIMAGVRLEKYIYDKVKSDLDYEADGVVIAASNFMYKYDSPDKPKQYIFAYKENSRDLEVSAEVESIIWQASAFTRLIPKVKIKPTIVQGAKVTYVTCHNAQWLEEHKIGPGAVIKVIRSGDVIPKIVGVVKPANHPQLPNCSYYKDGVHFYLKEESEDAYIKQLERTLNSLGIEKVKYRTLLALKKQFSSSFDSHPLSSIIRLFNTKGFLQKLQAIFGNKAGQIIYSSLAHIFNKEHTIVDYLLASCVFDAGIGRKRLNAINDNISLIDLLNLSKNDIYNELVSIKSIGSVLAKQIAEGLVEYNKVYSSFNFNYASIEKPKAVLGCMTGCNVTFTGYRDKNQAAAIESLGGSIIDFSNKTTWLLYKPDGKKSSKIEKAGAKAVTWEQLVDKYPQLASKINSLF